MRKLFSTFIAIAMMASTCVSTAFAEGNIAFTTTANKATYEEDKAVTVYVTVAGDPFANFGVSLKFDKDIFEFTSASNSTGSGLSGIVFGPADASGNLQITDTINATFGTTANLNPTTPNPDYDEDDESMGPEYFQNVYKFQAKFKVKTNVPAGDYTFDLEPLYACKDQAAKELSATYSDVTVHVNGTKTDEPDIVPATATFDDEKQEGTVYGLKGSIAANDQTVTGVAFKVNNGEKDGNVNATFTQAIAKNSNVTFGVNIKGIPSGITLGYVADSLAPVAE